MKRKSFFNPVFLIAAAICFAWLSTQTARAQQSSSCCKCPIPSVGIFDFTQNISPFTDTPPNNDYSALDFKPWNDAQKGFLEGYLPEVKTDVLCSLHFTSITLGDNYKELVASGLNLGNRAAMGDFDYVLAGKVNGIEGNYTLKVALVDGTNKEKVAETQTNFVSASEAKVAGQRAATQMLPLYEKICDFWRKKREENTENAVHPTILIKPQKDKVNVGDSISVEINLLDCDKSPLKNRKVHLSSEYGAFTPADVTTDASGKATVQFKATKAEYIGTLNAEHIYKNIVKHKSENVQAFKAVEIKDPPSGVWRVNLNISEEDRVVTDFSKSDEDSRSETHEVKVVRRNASLMFFVKGEYDSYFRKFSGGEILAFGGGGNFSTANRLTISSQNPLGSSWQLVKFEGGGVLDREDFKGFSFEVAPDKASVSGTVPFVGKYDDYSYSIHSGSTPCCVTQQQTVDETAAIGFGFGNDQIEIPVTPQDLKNGIFTFRLDKTETENFADRGETDTRTRSGTITLEQLKRSQTPVTQKPPRKP